MGLDPISSLAGLADTVVQRIWPDPTEADKDKMTLAVASINQETAAITGQLAIDQAEAANANMFVSGWRPAIGWICALGLFYQFFVQPLLSWASSLWAFPIPPALVTADLYPLLMGMLGLGAMRTTERLNGVIPKGK